MKLQLHELAATGLFSFNFFASTSALAATAEEASTTGAATAGQSPVAAGGDSARAEAVAAEKKEDGAKFDPHALSLSTNLGLLQPLVLRGANVEVDVRYGWLVAGYSHGWSLDLEGDSVVGEMHDQGVALHIPYSTGFGIGPSLWVDGINTYFDLRLEGKVHRIEASYDSADGETRTHIVDYNTFTLGGGAYATVMPFEKQTSILRGLNASFSVRYWPNVGSTLKGDKITYDNERTGQRETHEAANIGIANSPLVVNLSIGYAFQ